MNDSTGQPLSLFIGNIPILVSNKGDKNGFNWMDVSNEKIPTNTDGPFLPSECKLLLYSTINSTINQESKTKNDLGWYGLISGVRAFPVKNDINNGERNEKNGKSNRLDFSDDSEISTSQKSLLKNNHSLYFMPTVCLIRYNPTTIVDNGSDSLTFQTIFLDYRDAVFWNNSLPSMNGSVTPQNPQSSHPLFWGVLTLNTVGRTIKIKWINKLDTQTDSTEFSFNLPLYVSKIWSILSIHNSNYILYATANENQLSNENYNNEKNDTQYLILSLPGDPSLDFLKNDYNMNIKCYKRTLSLLSGERVIDIQYQANLIPNNDGDNNNDIHQPIGVGILTTLRVLILIIPPLSPLSTSLFHSSNFSSTPPTSFPTPYSTKPSSPTASNVSSAALDPLQISNSHVHSSITHSSSKISPKISSNKQGTYMYELAYRYTFVLINMCVYMYI
jgi:hypothetical protein